MELRSTQQAMNGPYVCGVDSAGDVLVADHHNKMFQIHDTNNQWLVLSIDAIASHKQLDFYYDSVKDTVWILTRENDRFYVTELVKLQ